MTDLQLDPSKPLTHRYGWRNNERRAELYGRACRLLISGKMGTVLIEMENGERVTTSRRALRKLTGVQNLVANQTELPEEAKAVLYNNLWDLYL